VAPQTWPEVLALLKAAMAWCLMGTVVLASSGTPRAPLSGDALPLEIVAAGPSNWRASGSRPEQQPLPTSIHALIVGCSSTEAYAPGRPYPFQHQYSRVAPAGGSRCWPGGDGLGWLFCGWWSRRCWGRAERRRFSRLLRERAKQGPSPWTLIPGRSAAGHGGGARPQSATASACGLRAARSVAADGQPEGTITYSVGAAPSGLCKGRVLGPLWACLRADGQVSPPHERSRAGSCWTAADPANALAGLQPVAHGGPEAAVALGWN